MSLVFSSVKIVDIAYVTILYFVTGYMLSQIIDEKFKSIFKNYKTDSNRYLLFQIVLQIAVLGIFSYIFRNIIELIPYPLNGVGGYDHLLLKELRGPGLLTFFLILFSYNLQNKITIITSRNVN